MKLRIASDFHLEFYNSFANPRNGLRDINDEVLVTKTVEDSQQTLLLAGDILGSMRGVDRTIIENLSERFKAIYIVMGNHEHYGKEFYNTYKYLNTMISDLDNVWILEKEYAILDDDTALYGGTLWTNFDNENEFYMNYAKHGMNDYRFIMKDSRNFIEPADTLMEFKETFPSLVEFFKLPQKNKIVMTHHLPTYHSVHSKYKGSPLNHAFASDLNDFILKYSPDYWIHGHTHASFDYMLGDTRIICNPHGYHDENKEYNPNLTIDINEEKYQPNSTRD